MFINFDNFSVKKDFINSTYEMRYSLESKDKGHIGSIYFTKEMDGTGYIELCRENTMQGYGEKLSLEELLELLESRKT